MPKLIINKKSQAKDIKKAQQVLQQLEAGIVYPRLSKKNGYLTLTVSRCIRLLSTDGGEHYELMSHSTYNRIIDKK